MKKYIILAILTISAIPAGLALAKSGDKNAAGQISGIMVQNPVCYVKGQTEGGSLWLGYTVYWNDGHEQDYEPMKVKGNFSKTLTFNALHPEGLRNIVVCLWRYKVSSSECAKDNDGTACEYCRKNGCHMEDRIDCQNGN